MVEPDSPFYLFQITEISTAAISEILMRSQCNKRDYSHCTKSNDIRVWDLTVEIIKLVGEHKWNKYLDHIKVQNCYGDTGFFRHFMQSYWWKYDLPTVYIYARRTCNSETRLFNQYFSSYPNLPKTQAKLFRHILENGISSRIRLIRINTTLIYVLFNFSSKLGFLYPPP